jgi:hypothetical protein
MQYKIQETQRHYTAYREQIRAKAEVLNAEGFQEHHLGLNWNG